MYYYNRNLDNIAKLADNTRAAATQWHNFLVENKINILIYETIRTKAKQEEYYKTGASKTMKSYHIVGQALDFVPVDANGKVRYDWYSRTDIKRAITKAKQLGFEWGGDWKTFVDKPHLQFNYKGYGTDPIGTTTSAPAHSTNTIVLFQQFLNKSYSTGIKSDGIYGPKTKAAALKGLQTEMNATYNAKLVVDGTWGAKTKAAIHSVRLGTRGNVVKILQGMLYCNGYDPKGLDGIFGKGCAAAVLKFQKDNRLTQDAIVGKDTFEKLFR